MSEPEQATPTSTPQQQEEQALALMNRVATVASKDIDVPFIEDIVGATDAEDVVYNVKNTPYKSRRRRRTSESDDVPPLPFNIQEELSECTSIPPTDRSDTAWIVALLWFLSRENQRATSGYLRKPGNVKKVALIKQYVNKNFPRGLNELSWSENWQMIKEFGIGDDSISVHDLVSTAKAYLLEMPDSLIPDKHQPFWNQIIDRAERGDSNWIRGAQHLLLLLPAGRCYLLKTVLKYLKIVSTSTPRGEAQLDVKGIFTCFAGCISRPPSGGLDAVAHSYSAGLAVVRALVEHHDEVTAVPEQLEEMLVPGYRPVLPASTVAASPARQMELPGVEAVEGHNAALEVLERQCEEQVAQKSENIVKLESTLKETPRKFRQKRKQLMKEIKMEGRALKHAAKTLGHIVSNTPRKEFQKLGFCDASVTPAATRDDRPSPLSEVRNQGALPSQLRFATPLKSGPQHGASCTATPASCARRSEPTEKARVPPVRPDFSSTTGSQSSKAGAYPKQIVCPTTPGSPSRRYCGQIAGSKETYV